MSSPLTRTNPLVLLAVGLLGVPASLGVRDLRTGVTALAVVIVLGLLLVPEVTRGAWRLLAPAFAALSVAWSTWLLGGHDLAARGDRVLPGAGARAAGRAARAADRPRPAG